MDMETTDGKRKPRRFSLIGLLFAHRANGGLSFVCLLTKKQTEVIHLQINLIGLPNYAYMYECMNLSCYFLYIHEFINLMFSVFRSDLYT
jgi:hypothetical protein